MIPTADTAQSKENDSRDRVLWQIGHCLRKNCVICLEHARQLSPRFTKWEPWGTPRCYSGDPQQLRDDIARCCEEHADHHIRLQIEDYQFHSRFSFVVHSPTHAA